MTVQLSVPQDYLTNIGLKVLNKVFLNYGRGSGTKPPENVLVLRSSFERFHVSTADDFNFV